MIFSRGHGTFITPQSETDGLELLKRLNREHMAAREGDSRLDARIASMRWRPSFSSELRRCWISLARRTATRNLYGLDEKN